MDPVMMSLGTSLLATGIATGTGVTAGKVRDVLHRRKYHDDLEHVAAVFAEELKAAIEAENDWRDTNELAGVTDEWEAVVEEVTGSDSDDDSQRRDDVDHLFEDEEDAAIQIAEAIATVQGFDLAKTPQLREELIAAVGDAYAEAVVAFEQRLADTDLVDVFQQELQLDVRETLADLEERVTLIADEVSTLLTQDIRNEGFRRLSPVYFDRATPTPETSWRTTFTLADVEAGIPARRDGHEDRFADEELLAALREGDDRLVVGRAGAGKSTLCKQVAIAWYQDSALGAVLYRDSDGGAAFESQDALREAVDRADGHVLVVVEDAIRANARVIFDVIEEYDSVTDVTFLLDARSEELDDDPDAQTLDRSGERRQIRVAGSIERYYLPAISEADVERTIEAFEAATGMDVERSAGELYDEIRSEGDEGIGRFLMLSFHLPFGDAAVERGENESGLEVHVRSRYETVMNPGSDGALRDLSRFNADILADVGVMVNLLNASGIGIYPELVHALGYEYGHDVETHDEIEEIREALEGWFLFPATDNGDQVRTTHSLWSTLYLRTTARDYQEQRTSSRRRDRSEPHAARCLQSLFSLFDDDAHLEAVSREFPISSVLTAIEASPEEGIDTCVRQIFELIDRWPVLVPLAGTTTTARYDLPAICSNDLRRWVVNKRGHAHLDRGMYQKAKGEYEHLLNEAKNAEDQHEVASSLGNLGLVARNLGEYEQAKNYHQQSLEIERELNDRRGEAYSLNNLATVVGSLGEYKQAKNYLQQSLELQRELGDRRGEAYSLNNLGLVARNLAEYERAWDFLQQCLKLVRKLGDRQGEANSLSNLGTVAQNLDKYEQAKEYHQQSLELVRELGDLHGEANNLGNLGMIAQNLSEYKQAREYHRQSLEIERELGNRQGEATSLRNLGIVAQILGDDDRACEYYRESLSILRDLGHPDAEDVELVLDDLRSSQS